MIPQNDPVGKALNLKAGGSPLKGTARRESDTVFCLAGPSRVGGQTDRDGRALARSGLQRN